MTPDTCSRSRGQRSRSQRYIMYQHQKIVTFHERIMSTKFKHCANYSRAYRKTRDTLCSRSSGQIFEWQYSTADCSISLKFGTEVQHAPGHTLQLFKVKRKRSRSQRKVRSTHGEVMTSYPFFQHGGLRVGNLLQASVLVTALVKKCRNLFAH